MATGFQPNTDKKMGVGGLVDQVSQAGRNIGEYWSGSNAQFEAGNPSTLARVGRSVNPVTGFGSALGAMHDGASKGSTTDMGIAAAQAIPLFAVAGKVKQVVGPMLATVANTGKTASRAATGTAASVAADEVQAMRPGLRNGGELKTGHGGHVPGAGKGDKIPAKYEPGEFVVSNAMLAKNPGLREQLHSLRADALADKGMTPEQADAKAVGPRGFIRAASGYSRDDPRSRMGVQTPAEISANNDRMAGNFNTARAGAITKIDAPGRVTGSTYVPAPDPRVMTQGVDGVTAPGQSYPGRSLVPTSAPFPTSDARGMVPVDAGRGFTPPVGGSYDPNTIRQGANTAAPSNLATTGGSRELALTGDAGRATTSMGRPANPSFADNGQSIEGEAYRIQRFNEKYSKVPGAPSAPAAVGFKAVAGNVAKNLGLGAVGFGAARLMDNMGNNAPDAGPEARANVNAIPTGGNAPAPAAGQPTGWWDTNTGRNVGNTLNAVTPFLGPLAGTVRAGSNVSRLANTGAAVIGGMAAGATSPEIPFAAPDTAGAGRGTVNPTQADVTAAQASKPAAVPTPAPTNPNQITATRQPNGTMSFSGGPNIGKDGGDISYTGAAGFKPSGAGVTVVPGGSFANGSPAGDAALSAARMAAADRGDFDAVRDSYFAQGQGFGGQTRDSVAADRLREIALSPQGTPGRKAAQQMYGQELTSTTTRQTNEAANKLAQQKFGLDSQEFGLKQTAAGFQSRAAKRIEDLQAAYEAAPADQKGAIAEQLRVMTGKDKPAQWKAIALQGSTDAMGNKTEGVLAAVNEQTGESRRLDQGGAKSATAIPAQAAAMLKANPKMAADFDAKYGAGAAARTMGQK